MLDPKDYEAELAEARKAKLYAEISVKTKSSLDNSAAAMGVSKASLITILAWQYVRSLAD